MFRNRITHALAVAGVVVLMSATTTGCVATARPRAGVVYVTDAPPRAIREVRPVSPGRGYAWVPGFYAYRGRSYVWVAGHWARPEFDNFRRWEPGKWRHDRNGWYWVEGRWR